MYRIQKHICDINGKKIRSETIIIYAICDEV